MINQARDFIWGPWMLALFLGMGIFYTVKSGFFQIRGLPVWLKSTIGSLGEREEGGGITKFQTACTALAATIGTGNIVGVATALTAGGPGAIFWMWISAAIGMMTAYGETALGIRYRYRDENGQWVCGPMVYLERGMKKQWLALAYSLLCVMVSLGMGTMVQSNSIAETMSYSFQVPPGLSAILLTGCVFLVISGGIKRIAGVSERLIPWAAGIYIFFSLTVILSCYDRLPYVLETVFRDAFSLKQAAAGAAGYGISRSMQYGVARGVFSHEAGLGSMAVLHGAAENTTPQQQGMWAMFEVFFDTILICTMTALVILCMTGADPASSGYDGAALTARCFAGRLGGLGEIFVSAMMVLFAFATIIAWYYLGKQAAGHLTDFLKKRGICYGIQVMIGDTGYLFLYLAAVFAGALLRLETVWAFSDIWNGLMALPNLAALMVLSGQVIFPRNTDKK